MTADVESMFELLCAERGGIDSLSAVALAVARALAVALCAEPIVPTTVAQLTALLSCRSDGVAKPLPSTGVAQPDYYREEALSGVMAVPPYDFAEQRRRR